MQQAATAKGPGLFPSIAAAAACLFVSTLLFGCGSGATSPDAPPASTGRWAGAQPIDEPLEPDPGCGVTNSPTPIVGMDEAGVSTVAWRSGCRIQVARHSRDRGWTRETIFAGAAPRRVPEDPALAVSAGGDVIVAWEGPGAGTGRAAWASRRAGLAWSPPEILGPPSLRSEVPVIALDRQGNGLVLWRSETILAAHYDKAKGWQPPEDLGSGSGYGPGAWLDLRGSGFGAWVAPDSSGLVQRFDPARGWGALTRFSPPDEHTFTRMGRLAFDGRGRAILLWHLVRGGRFLAPLWSASFDGETWSARGLISRPGQQVDVVHGSGAAVGMTTAGQGLAAWVEYGDGQDRLSSATFGFEQGWSTPEALAVAPFIGDVRVAINERGDGMLVYVAAEIESSLVTKYRLLAQRRLSGRWGPAELLRNGATKASLAVDPSGNAVVVWSEPAAEGIRIFANRFEVDAP